jgi:hypothetical protein
MRAFLTTSVFALVASTLAASDAKKPTKPGFVTTKGTQFELDGKPFVRLHSFGHHA